MSLGNKEARIRPAKDVSYRKVAAALCVLQRHGISIGLMRNVQSQSEAVCKENSTAPAQCGRWGYGMRVLDRARLFESPDHAVIARPWDFDVLELNCCWAGGNDGLSLEVLMSKPLRTEPVRLRFTGVFDLRLDGFRPLSGFRILDTGQFRPGIPAPICVISHQWARNEEEEPYFWASSVERSPSE